MSSDEGWFAHASAVVDEPAEIGRGTKVWHFSHVMAGSCIGEDCTLGQNVFVGSGARIGRRVKIQNNVSVYSGTIVEDDVFLGPSCVLTNISNPRSEVNRRAVYEPIVIHRGATIGANATILCGISIGRHAFVAAGAVVTLDVPDYALMMGVPAGHVGWVSRHGHRLELVEGGAAICPEGGYRYELRDGRVTCLDLDEDAPLPPDKATSAKRYRHFKQGAR